MDRLNSPNAAWACFVRSRTHDRTDALVLINMAIICKAVAQYGWAEFVLEMALDVAKDEDQRSKILSRLYHAQNRCNVTSRYEGYRMCSHCELIANNDTILGCPCERAWYCANDHCQHADWEKHKENCLE
jgi:hypothetical protein